MSDCTKRYDPVPISDSRARFSAVVTALLAFGAAFALGTGRVPLREWLRSHAPGWEWLASLVIPLLFLLFMFMRFRVRRRRVEVSAAEPTRADAIDNRPIE